MLLEHAAKEVGNDASGVGLPSGDVPTLLLVALAYFTVAYFGLQLASINPSATPVWPATGLAIAVVLLWGHRIALAIFIAAFIVNYLTTGSGLTSAAIAVGNTLEALATAYFVNRWADGVRVFESPAGVGRFALISAVTTTISATLGVSSLLLAGYAELPPRDLPDDNRERKLTEDQVREIRKRIAEGDYLRRIAKDMKVSLSSVYDIKSRRRWRWLV